MSTKDKCAEVEQAFEAWWAKEQPYHDDKAIAHCAWRDAWQAALASAGAQPSQAQAGEAVAKPISDEMMDLVDRLGSEWDKVDPRAWRSLLIYAPKNTETRSPEGVSYEHLFELAKKCGLIGAYSVKEVNDRIVGYAQVVLNDKAVQEAFIRSNCDAEVKTGFFGLLTRAQMVEALAIRDASIAEESRRDATPPASPVASNEREGLTDAAYDVLAERQRQVTAEGWTPVHDDEHDDYEMALAAIVYAESAVGYHTECPDTWPWSPMWFKPTAPRRDLVKAGALILAEIERIDRAARTGEGHE